MLYIIDAHARPPLVVDMTTDQDAADATAQRYATQVGRPVLIAAGPAPAKAQFNPTIPRLE